MSDRIKFKVLKEREIQELLTENEWQFRYDLAKKFDGITKYIELKDKRLICYHDQWDNKLQKFSDKKRKGYIMNNVEEFLSMMKNIEENSKYDGQHVLVHHSKYFLQWDYTGDKYIKNLLSILPVNEKISNFSKENIIEIDKNIRNFGIPKNVLKDSLFLPSIVGYTGIYLEKFQKRNILVEYVEKYNIYEPYYVNNGMKHSIYVPFYEEASENRNNFSIDEVIETNFF